MVNVLSSHIDDAVFSIGGIMLTWDSPFRIINIFSISNYAVNIEGASARDITRLRKQEDEKAAKILQCEIVNLDQLDRPLRGHARNNVNPEIIEYCVSRLKEIIKPCDVVYAPLGCEHIDHQMTNLIAQKLEREIIYYEDLPYKTIAPKGMKNQITYIDIERKMELVELYETQLSEKVKKEIYSHLEERIWY